MEKTAHQFCKQLGHMYRAKDRMTHALETVKFPKENPTRYPAWCRLFFELWQSATVLALISPLVRWL